MEISRVVKKTGCYGNIYRYKLKLTKRYEYIGFCIKICRMY